MSKVISFRLDPDNPREAMALEILRDKQREGFSSRRILADALISLEGKTGMSQSLSGEEFNEILEQIFALLENISNDNPSNASHEPIGSQPHALNDHFMQSVKVMVKPGINLKESNYHGQ